MKIDYVSDLHINHHIPFHKNQLKWESRTKELVKDLLKRKTGDVLVIAGDFSEWNNQSLWVLEEASRHYERVFFVVGNHDYYLLSKTQRKKYKNSLNRVDEFINKASLISGVVPLHKTVKTYKGIVFAGAGLWYTLDNDQDKQFYLTQSNDSKYIYAGVPYSETPDFLYKDYMDWYDSLEDVSIDVFVSHVPPLHPPISYYKRNACYDTTVPFIHASHWIFGHTHLVSTFKKGDINFYVNAYGYPSEKKDVVIQQFIVQPNRQ